MMKALRKDYGLKIHSYKCVIADSSYALRNFILLNIPEKHRINTHKGSAIVSVVNTIFVSIVRFSD